MKITKAIIPAAGYGTRFLPVTKAVPKEMFPLVDKPIIQVVVEELVEAGITDIIIVVGKGKEAIKKYFEDYPELEEFLEVNGKLKELEKIKRVQDLAHIKFISQVGKIGNAVPIYNALEYIGNEPFLVFWGDDFVLAEPSRAKQLIRAYEKYNCSILGAIESIDPEDALKYGFAKGPTLDLGEIEVENIVEKPGLGNAPSNLAIVSGFLFTPEIKSYFEKVIKSNKNGEPHYIDAISLMLKEGAGKVVAKKLEKARFFDTGSKLGLLKASIEFGLKHPETNKDLVQYIKKISREA